jgi:hypothetical protein
MRFTLKHNINFFEDYLKAQKKRNIRQIMCSAQRYHTILETGDASPLVNPSSGPIRRHAMEALAAYSKYLGCYEQQFQQIRKRYSLHWTDGNESLRAMERFFNPDLSLETMIAKVKEMISFTGVYMGQIVKFCVLTGLRSGEIIESVRLINYKEAFTEY